MLVKNILAIFAITGLAAAAPAEEFEARDLEERKDWYCQGETLCCSLVLGKSIGVFCKSSEIYFLCTSEIPVADINVR
ncbi:hypothetical protein N7490_009679 [Penicillium lividum]|nr:hypothetical protein N7490_009679 [Penicillium lividum]